MRVECAAPPSVIPAAIEVGGFVAPAAPEAQAPQSRCRQIGRKVMAGVMALSMSLHGNVVAGPVDNEIVRPTLEATHMMVPTPDAKAPAASEASLRAVETMINTPTAYAIKNKYDIIEARYEAIMASNPDQGSLSYRDLEAQMTHQIHTEAAARNGVHILDAYPTTKQLYEDLRQPKDKRMPYDQYLTLANDFLRQYNGLQFYHDDSKKLGDDLQPATPETLGSEGTKRLILEIVEAAATTPVEYLTHIGTKKIYLTESKPGTEPGASAYVTLGSTDIVFIVNTFGVYGIDAGKTFHHEVAHLWDEHLTNRQRNNDPQFAATVDGIPYGKVGPKPEKDKDGKQLPDRRPLASKLAGALTLTDFQVEINKLHRTFDTRDMNADCAPLAAKLDEAAQKLGEQVYFPRDYSSEEMGEHKADIAKLTTDPTAYQLAFSPLLPHIREQSIQQLARLRDEELGIVGYLMDVATHPEKTPVGQRVRTHSPEYFAQACIVETRTRNDYILMAPVRNEEQGK